MEIDNKKRKITVKVSAAVFKGKDFEIIAKLDKPLNLERSILVDKDKIEKFKENNKLDLENRLKGNQESDIEKDEKKYPGEDEPII